MKNSVFLHSLSRLEQDFLLLAAILCSLFSPEASRGACPTETAIWSETFEVEGLPRGWTSAGSWENGQPTNPGGPRAAHEGVYCVSVGLDANHSDNISASLYSPSIAVPPATHNPRLRFWHWFSINAGGACNQPGDHAKVYVVLTNGTSEVISPDYYWNSDWTRASIDLGKYAGQSVRFQFYFYANCAGNAPGWFIDEVTVLTNAYQLATTEDFECGLGNWAGSRGHWQVGTPTSGPARAHSGQQCAGVVLDGSYPDNVASSLVSPWTTVPAEINNPRLRFWHWFSIDAGGACNQPGDYARVYIWLTNGTSEIISPDYYWNSDWTRASLDLDKYAGQPVRFQFYFFSNCAGRAPGWFIDDVSVVTNAYQLAECEDFESGLGDWSASRGNWQVGTPTNGPARAHSGQQCAGVVLKGSHPDNVASSLLSPWTTVPEAINNPRLRFWHWFSIDAGGACNQSGDYARLYVWLTNGTSEIISPDYYWNSDWTRASLDLGKYAGQPVRFQFYFFANCAGRAPGWFIDDVCVVTNAYQLATPEGFEAGLGDWAPDRGNWQVGTPIDGPRRAHSGNDCAGVVLKGNYFDNTSSSLVSPWFTVPDSSQSPQLRFWHWFSINPGGACNQPGDFGMVYVRFTNGTSEAISPAYSGNSDWINATINLSKYAGQPVRLLFYFYSNCAGTAPGWFIDDLCIETGNLQFNVIGNRAVDEQTNISFQVSVRGTNSSSCVHYALGPGAPAGTSIDPITGIFSWTPNEAQGPSINWVPILAIDPCNGWMICSYPQIIVREVNRHPEPMEHERVIQAGRNLSFALCYTDPDLPKNHLSYVLLPGAPDGAVVGPTTGIFSWTPTSAQAGTHTMQIRVTDDGSPSLTATGQVTVIVATNVPVFSLGMRVLTGGASEFTVDNGSTGIDYVLQAASVLEACTKTNWQDVYTVPERPAVMPFKFQFVDPAFETESSRFYRLRTK